MSTSSNVLSVKSIEVIYDHVILVLKGVSLEVPEGGIVALLGANGAGKTTTLKAVSSLLRSEQMALAATVIFTLVMGPAVLLENGAKLIS